MMVEVTGWRKVKYPNNTTSEIISSFFNTNEMGELVGVVE
jgi:hypothetical protein